MKNVKRGMLLAVINMVSLALVGIVDKHGVSTVPYPLQFSAQSVTFTAFYIFILSIMYFQARLVSVLNSIRRTQFVSMIVIGIFASGLFILFRFLGLSESTGTFATLSQIITTSLTALFARIVLKEKLNKVFWIFFTIIIFATYVSSTGTVALTSIKSGDLLILAGTLFLATSNIITKRVVGSVSPLIAGLFRGISGGIFLIVTTTILYGFPLLSISPWAVLSGFFWMINIVVFNFAIRDIGVTLPAAILMIAPVFTLILEHFLLSRDFSPIQVISSLVIVLCGVAMIVTKKK